MKKLLFIGIAALPTGLKSTKDGAGYSACLYLSSFS